MDSELTNTNETNEQTASPAADASELEARIKALEAENGKLKQSVTNASSDASKWKKQYQEKLSAEEKAKQEQEEAIAAVVAERDQLRLEKNIAEISGALTAPGIGMDAETAKSVAKAMNDGDTAKVLDGIRQFVIAHDKSLREDAIRGNQTLQGGRMNVTVTKEQFDNMGYTEMVEFKQTNPELYAEYMKRKE